MKKRIRKSAWLALALFLYVTAMAAYFLPRNTEIGDTEKYVTLGASYVIVGVLWAVLRRKELLQERRREEERNNKQKLKRERK